jgi:hypothetical protein
MKTIQIDLPDDLVLKAESAGLLTAEAMEAMLREWLRRRAGEGDAAGNVGSSPP